ncbi:hypothetical protein [Streptomyces sp. NPDC057382]|uniref:hypothetical protein n=1 Tax=unclassified Streptomyces TaxID=2593676 RepID=UPI00363B74FB
MATVAGLFVPALAWFWIRREQRRREFKANYEEFLDRTLATRSATMPNYGRLQQEFLELKEEEKREIRERKKQFGPRLRMIGTLLPEGDEWRLEEMLEHRNVMRAEGGRVPRFHYVRLFLSALEIRWEARAHPEPRVD